MERLKSKENFTTPLECPFITHWLHNMSHDQVLDMMKYLGMSNSAKSKGKSNICTLLSGWKGWYLEFGIYDWCWGMT